ncbi:MAG: TIGR01777 family protein [Chitinophagaceae bacterium]|nr:MAG: TIGR01777 family protein [Chitinophagaceae bacterium]
MATIIITGGTGLIGTALSKMLIERGHSVIVLTRKKRPSQASLRYASWNVSKGEIDGQAISEADYIIHLAGAGVVDEKWTAARKQEIIDSRVKSGELIVSALAANPNKIRAVIAASAIGWYGPDPVIPNPHPFTEESPHDNSFLGNTCYLWEKSLDPLLKTNIRLVKLRTGIVLSNDGGALAEFKKPVRLGIAGILGSGRQIISWIHIEDLCRQYLYAIDNDNISGVYNAVAPHPVSNRDLTLTLAKRLKGNFYIPVNVPEFVLKLMMGDRSIEVLKSATVSTDKLHAQGFTFIYPSIEAAINELVRKTAAGVKS